MIYRLWQGLLDFFLPRRCLHCGSVVPTRTRSVPICDHHWSKVESTNPLSCRYCARNQTGDTVRSPDQPLHYSKKPICGHCRKRSLELEFLLAGFRFGPVLRSIVSDWKFDSHREWGPWLSKVLSTRVKMNFDLPYWDILAPVPMYYRRRRERGFNQAEQLAEGLAAAWTINSVNLLAKHRRTDPQSSLGRDERMDNLRNAFSLRVDPNYIQNRTVLLVDDVYTTGSTLRTAARVLHDAGASTVAGVVLARTPPDRAAP